MSGNESPKAARTKREDGDKIPSEKFEGSGASGSDQPCPVNGSSPRSVEGTFKRRTWRRVETIRACAVPRPIATVASI